MRLDPAAQLGVGRRPERGEVAARRADSDAREPCVGRKDVGDLVAVQRELGSVGGFAVWAAPSGHVAVVQGAQGFDLVLGVRRDFAGDQRAAPVRADDHAAQHVVLGVAIAEPGADDPSVLAQESCDRRGLRDRDALRARSPSEEQIVERAAADGEAEPRLAGLLRRAPVGARCPEAEAPLPPERGRAKGEHLVEDRELVEHGDEPVAAEEVRRDRGARKPHALDEEDAEAPLREKRRDGRACDPRADHDDVAGVISLTHRESAYAASP